MAARFFKLEEAEKLIPVLEGLLATAINSKKKVDALEAELNGLNQRILFHGGILVDSARTAGMKTEKDSSAQQLREALEQIEFRGCLIKDLDIGLIDFPCKVNQREIYLCWKMGEPSIGFWHNTDEGFAGRKPIDNQVIEGQRLDDEPRPN